MTQHARGTSNPIPTITLRGIKSAIASADAQQHVELHTALEHLYMGSMHEQEPQDVLSAIYHHVAEQHEVVIYGTNRGATWRLAQSVFQHVAPDLDNLQHLTLPNIERVVEEVLEIKFVEEIRRSTHDYHAFDLLCFSIAQNHSDLEPVSGQELAFVIPVLWMLDHGYIVPFFEQFVNVYRATQEQWSDNLLRDGIRDMFHGAIIQAFQCVVDHPRQYDHETVFDWQSPILSAQYMQCLEDVLTGQAALDDDTPMG